MLEIFSCACSNLRYLEDGQRLYTGHRLHIEAEEKTDERRMIEKELEAVIRPLPNQQFLFWKPRLWLFNVAGDPTGKGVRHLMKNRFGRPPVLYDPESANRNVRLVQNRLFNLGYFDAKVEFVEQFGERTASADYNIMLRRPYVFGTYHNLIGDTVLAASVNAMIPESKLRPGQAYRLEMLKAERIRIDRTLREEGYFYFHPDYILFRADSVAGSRVVDIYPSLKPDMPPRAAEKYRVGHVSIFIDYPGSASPGQGPGESMEVRDGLYLFERSGQFTPSLFERAVFLRFGDAYRASDHDRTLTHLTSLGIFQFVNMRFIPRYGATGNLLDVRVTLTPAPKKSLTAELIGVSKSNNFAGPGFKAAFTNINLFGGAEHLNAGINMSYETLLGGGEMRATSREFGVETSLDLPRFVLLPRFIKPPPTMYVPKTSISLSASRLSRTDAFTLTSARMQYSYDWNQRMTTRHRLSPLVLNLFVLGKVYQNIEKLVADGSLLRRGLFEQFILGAEYSLFYNTQHKEAGPATNDLYFNANVDLSGNVPYLLFGLFNFSRTHDGEYQVFSKGFSQFARTDFDFRYYRRFGDGQRLATRLLLGVGLPYGNSTSLPYLKLFTIGGSNSIRAFHPRTLGPGAYAPPDSLAGGFNIYQSGEIKLEMNAEYRFDITSILKGAIFADAGNIWRIQDDENTPGGQFRWSSFPGQIALGAGAGLRIDATLFILRFDFAIPLAIPYSGHDGFLDPVQPLNRQWRRDKLVFNLAIGYPF